MRTSHKSFLRRQPGRLALAMAFAVLASGAVHAQVVYVNEHATGSNNGTSWANAYTKLQDALVGASSTQIWVADGTYTADQGGGQTPGNKNATFSLITGVEVYGGFAGGETALSQRDVGDNHTILSGDLSGNDPTISDNTNWIVTSNGTSSTAVLDGFMITAGLANGGGLRSGTITSASQTVRNCSFVGNGGNIPPKGGAAYLGDGSPVFIGCNSIDNVAQAGGGVFVEGASPTFVNCRFLGNLAETSTGGSGLGGGLYAGDDGAVSLINCTFTGNVAEAYAGAVYRGNSGNFTIRCSTFSGNVATTDDGGGIRAINIGNPLNIRNSTFWGNTGLSGDSSIDTELDGTAFMDVDYCCIQGYVSGLGSHNTGSNPSLLDVNGLDNVIGTLDDNVQVTYGSPIIDTANDASLPPDTYDLDGDSNTTEALSEDIVGAPRDFDGNATAGAISDMSAYEFIKCQPDVGYDGPGHLKLTVCGADLTTASSSATLLITGASSNQAISLVTSLGVALTPYNGGLSTLVPDVSRPDFIYIFTFNADANGEVTFTINGGSSNLSHVFMQAVGAGTPKIVSNAIDVHMGN